MLRCTLRFTLYATTLCCTVTRFMLHSLRCTALRYAALPGDNDSRSGNGAKFRGRNSQYKIIFNFIHSSALLAAGCYVSLRSCTLALAA
jgi:hypothetical protein